MNIGIMSNLFAEVTVWLFCVSVCFETIAAPRKELISVDNNARVLSTSTPVVMVIPAWTGACGTDELLAGRNSGRRRAKDVA